MDSILPDAAPEFIVHLQAIPYRQTAPGEWQQQRRAFLYCAARKALQISVRDPMELFAIRFRPWGVRRFSRVSMAEMLDHAVSPGDALGTLGEQLAGQLLAARTARERAGIADSLLTEALGKNAGMEKRLKKLLDASNGGRCTSSEMARQLAVSDRSFSRLWKELVGIQPRYFIQLMRFHQALELIDAGIPLKQVAAECGFSDQAHMARQIKTISGLTPTALGRRLGEPVYRDLYTERPDAPWRPSSPHPPG
ncbi:MAG: helix-turn-helix domain-containing protein [Xanthomonadales bacterium]|nr:helix-turn-helix domain-containing protein [Xanthomonadales bacterium]